MIWARVGSAWPNATTAMPAVKSMYFLLLVTVQFICEPVLKIPEVCTLAAGEDEAGSRIGRQKIGRLGFY